MQLSNEIRAKSIRRVHLATEDERLHPEYVQTLTPADIIKREVDRKYLDRERSIVKLIRGMIRRQCECDQFAGAAAVEYKDCAGSFTVNSTTEGLIAWQTAEVTSSYIAYDGAGTFRPLKEGIYAVHVWFYDEYTNTSAVQELRIYGNGSTDTNARAIYSGVNINVYGSKLVYCNGSTDTIDARIYNGGIGTNTYRLLGGARHESYIHINYEGNDSTITY